ncbi:glycosyl transferase family protein [Trinickia dinghuensis]|uniref:Glycosyl transferase family protein n=1 Tax=Trinickia dinghuensis TaxID=2291023 RepID=A0A3D8JUT2_9BURK|nr:glycosyl transferase family protein [Trinickia dinghuensis]RDU96354.1 glycosyl transferase family protein [Trinickia dinghuensis]
MHDISAWGSYLSVLNAVAMATAFIIFISTMDDLFLDGYYWLFQFKRLLRGESNESVDAQALRELDEQYLAIMVPAWKEYDVIAKMIDNTLATMEYERYIIFAGTYHNDAETTAEVERMVRRHPGRVVRATVLNDGPTCKADCLNWIIGAIRRYETTHHIEFAGVIMHDCEDVIHPIELKYFNYAIRDNDLVQLPVLSLPRKWNEFVAGTYMDDFSETHQKDIPSRQMLTGIVPGAGVASCYSRRAIEAVSEERGGKPFNTSTLTEDYDFSFRLRELGMREMFARFPIAEVMREQVRKHRQRVASARNLLATREYFPSTLRTAYRQRTRWILGISFQGWQQLGWRGSWRDRYMFFRDRKGMVTSIVSIVAYAVLINYVAVAGLRAAGVAPPGTQGEGLVGGTLAPLLAINTVLLVLRLSERFYFVAKLNGVLQGALSLPRMFVNNLINFLAVCRAWRIFVNHLITGKPIAWDKTSHTYLSNDQLGKARRKLGEILVEWGVATVAQIEEHLARQAECGKRLGELLLEGDAVSAETLADALAEQAELPRVSLANLVVGHFNAAFTLELQRAYRAVPFSMADDGTLNVAVGSPLTDDEKETIKRATNCNVAYFVASDAEIAAELARHARRSDLDRGNDTTLPTRRAAPPAQSGES